MATDRYTVVVDTKGAEGNLNRLSAGAGKLKGALVGAFAVGAIGKMTSEVLRAGEAYETMRRKLQLVTVNQTQLNSVLNELTAVSGRTASALEGTVDLYQRMALATKDLSIDTPELIGLTEKLQKAFKISGASAEEQARGITQLGQGLFEGTIRMEEFNTLMDTMGAGMLKIAEASGMTVGELRALVREGELGSEMFLEMVQRADNLDETFSSLTTTTADLRTALGNTFTEALAKINETTDATGILNRTMIRLNNDIAALFGTSQDISDFTALQLFEAVQDGALKADMALVELQDRLLATATVSTGFGLFGESSSEIREQIDALKEYVDAKQREREETEAALEADREAQRVRKEMLKPLTEMGDELDRITRAYEKNIPQQQKLKTEYESVQATLQRLLELKGQEVAQTPEYTTALEATRARLAQLKAEMDGTAASSRSLNSEMKTLSKSTDRLAESLQKSTEDMRFELESLNMTPLQKDIAEIERDIKTRVMKQIQALEAAMTPENAAEITRQIDMLKDASSQAIEEQSRLARESYDYQRSFSAGWNRAFQQYADDATNAAKTAEDIFKTTTQGIEDAIVEFAKTGKLSLKSLGEDLSEQLLRGGIRDILGSLGGGGTGGGGNILGNLLGGIFPQQQQQQPSGGNVLGNLLGNIFPQQQPQRQPQRSSGGNLFGNILGSIFPQQQQQSSGSGLFSGISKAFSGVKKLFGGFFANGGYLPAGQFGIVGERGPEMISGPASIRPGTGGGGAMNVTINAVDAPSFQALVASDPEFIYSVAQRGSRSFV